MRALGVVLLLKLFSWGLEVMVAHLLGLVMCLAMGGRRLLQLLGFLGVGRLVLLAAAAAAAPGAAAVEGLQLPPGALAGWPQAAAKPTCT